MLNSNQKIMGTKEELQKIEQKRKELRAQVKQEYVDRVKKKALDKINRDKQIEVDDVVIREMLKQIFIYNKLGRVAKSKVDLFEVLKTIIKQGEIDSGR